VSAVQFGSVPLKTYLPDGDIDVSIFCKGDNIKSNWTVKLQEMLEAEQRNSKAQFKIADVQLINAEVGSARCHCLKLRYRLVMVHIVVLCFDCRSSC
jgi:hypothetical protein